MAARKSAKSAEEKAAEKAAAKTAAAEKAAADKAAKESAKEVEATKEPHVFRADMGEGLPPQADHLNPNRAK